MPFQFVLMNFVFRFFPEKFMRFLAFPVSFFYWLACTDARRNSRRFLDRAVPRGAKGHRPGTYRHIASFALSLTEKMQCWGGDIHRDKLTYYGDVDEFINCLDNGIGLVLLISHLGNAELLRAFADYKTTKASRDFPVLSLSDGNATAGYNAMLKKLNPSSRQRLVNANDIGVGSIEEIDETLTQGGVLVLAGDRLSANGKDGRTFTIPFLGKDALFPAGPFIIASLLARPVYYMYGLRQNALAVDGRYNMYVHKAAVSFTDAGGQPLPRKERRAAVEALAHDYARVLEEHCREQPFQWYNFVDFWQEDAE
jgi:predicted LPLAT superfamily acyltransferase